MCRPSKSNRFEFKHFFLSANSQKFKYVVNDFDQC